MQEMPGKNGWQIISGRWGNWINGGYPHEVLRAHHNLPMACDGLPSDDGGEREPPPDNRFQIILVISMFTLVVGGLVLHIGKR